MESPLDRIVAEKRREVARLKRDGIGVDRNPNHRPRRSFSGAISAPGRIGLIAEIKFASPSAGTIREKTDPVSIARNYEDGGAAAISLLTDRRFFGGELNQMPRLKGEVPLPVLRKDFIIDTIQVEESFLYGADAVLLISGILSHGQLKELLAAARDLGMEALTEVRAGQDLDKALQCGAPIIGINNRNLDTFEVDLKTTMELAPRVPGQCVLVSESGIGSGDDMGLLRKAGVDAVLVGTALMKSPSPLAKTRELVEAGRRLTSNFEGPTCNS